jgi:hypothetical protein
MNRIKEISDRLLMRHRLDKKLELKRTQDLWGFNTHQWLILFLISVSILISCEKEYPWKLQQTNNQTLVVDGILTNENKTQIIKLSLVNSEINKPVVPVSSAIVSVSDSIHLFTFSESNTEPGSYYSAPFQAVVGKRYVLKVEYQSRLYSASANMVPITNLGPINIIGDANKKLYKYEPETSGDPAMIEITYNWSNDTAYAVKYGNDKALETFYILNNVDANKVFAPEKEIIYFPVGTKIIRRQYSLSTDHQAFLRSLLMETEWRGGIFDVQEGNVISNISNGGLGFFGVCMVVQDSLIVK